MSIPTNPFAKPTAAPGQGRVTLEYLPPNKQVLTTFEYQYPLKLIAPDPHYVPVPSGPQRTTTAASEANNTSIAQQQVPVTTIFLLTYGGGLLARDTIHLQLRLQRATRLALLTQGSTKVFKADPLYPQTPSRQTLDVLIGKAAGLCYLPDPCQPFEGSVFQQKQRFYVSEGASLLMLDWVSEGRRARGESWNFRSWKGRNEVRIAPQSDADDAEVHDGGGRLLLRDSMLLQDEGGQMQHLELKDKTGGWGVVGTLIIYGSMFAGLKEFWMKEFKGLPRIGAKSWSGHTGSAHDITGEGQARITTEELLWTAANVRSDFVLVKFGAVEPDAGRQWLYDMLRKEGTVEREFGHQALLCLK